MRSKASCPCGAPHHLLGRNRTIVEIGANDGLHMSFSYFFETFLGWSSLCVEANPQMFKRFKLNRPRCKKVNALVGRREDCERRGREFDVRAFGLWMRGSACTRAVTIAHRPCGVTRLSAGMCPSSRSIARSR